MDVMVGETLLPSLITVAIGAPALMLVLFRLVIEIRERSAERSRRREILWEASLSETRRPTPRISPELRAEIDQTPEWWDGRFRLLVEQCFEPAPYVPADHEGHSVIMVQRYGSGQFSLQCVECDSRLVPRATPRRQCRLPDNAPPCVGCKCGSA